MALSFTGYGRVEARSVPQPSEKNHNVKAAGLAKIQTSLKKTEGGDSLYLSFYPILPRRHDLGRLTAAPWHTTPLQK